MKRHNCERCGQKLTCKKKESMQKLIDRHELNCNKKNIK